jgi:hypothetical protein
MKRKMCIGLAAVAALALASWTAYGAEEGKESHPHMRRAAHHLHQVKVELEAAKRDYSGDRVAALADAQKAMDEVVAGLESDGWKGPHTLAPEQSTSAPAEAKHHAEMHRALHHLRQAKWQLEHAAHDYHGHRAEALKFVEHAIKHVREGLDSVENPAK